mmetsp:Transcript_40120/g.67272  ORF Transcript_40120/g.67272 Transcript_40120/m.67272 type:complete len:90 (-) Transcript_40120:730-999(-)
MNTRATPIQWLVVNTASNNKTLTPKDKNFRNVSTMVVSTPPYLASNTWTDEMHATWVTESKAVSAQAQGVDAIGDNHSATILEAPAFPA